MPEKMTRTRAAALRSGVNCLTFIFGSSETVITEAGGSIQFKLNYYEILSLSASHFSSLDSLPNPGNSHSHRYASTTNPQIQCNNANILIH